MDSTSVKKQLASQNDLVIFFHGEESFFMDDMARYVDSQLVPEETKAFNYHVCYGKDSTVTQIVDAARRIPMGAPIQYVVVKEAQQLSKIDQLESYVDRPTPSTRLIVFYKKKLDGRKALTKKLKSAAVLLECKPLYENQVPRWLGQRLKQEGIQHDPQAVTILTEYLGTSLDKHADAINKLKINLQDGQMLTADLVRKHIGINKDYSVFALQSAMASKSVTKALRIINYYASDPKNNPVVLIINSLHRFYGMLLTLKIKGARSEAQIKSISGSYNPQALMDYREGVRCYSLPEIKRALHIVHRYDARSKGMGARNLAPAQVLKEMVGMVLSAK